MDQELADAAAYAQNDIMATTLKVSRKIGLHQLMCIYLKNIPVEFHPNPIWYDSHANNNKNKMSSDMGSVPDPKIPLPPPTTTTTSV